MAELLERRELLAAFQPGDIVVEQVGDGTNALTNTGNAIFLDEYTPTGTLVQSIPLPTQGISSNNPILADGTDPTEGLLSNSADGHFLLLPGYDQFITASPVDLAAATGNVDSPGSGDGQCVRNGQHLDRLDQLRQRGPDQLHPGRSHERHQRQRVELLVGGEQQRRGDVRRWGSRRTRRRQRLP